ncbi:MAG: alpha-amylase family glycosyl hydrolase [Candidatus Cryosericum sp.]
MSTIPTNEEPWWKRGIIYHCYVRSFMDRNGDGIGDLPGLISKLDYLQDGTASSLGIDGLWLSPIYPSPNRDFGYDISDYRAIDPAYGTLEDFDCLAAGAHARGIHIIMDLVVNHSSSEHLWFRMARMSRGSPFHDYYIWHPGKDGRPPNNWRSAFGGSAWEWNKQTHEFYLHSFLKEQPDLNWRNPQLRQEIHDIMRFWLDRGADGFRLDVANYYVKDALLRNNPREFIFAQPMPGNPSATLVFPMWREVPRYSMDQPETHEALQEMRRVLDEKPGTMMVGEITQRTLPQVLSYYGDGTNELNLVFNFFFLVRRFRASDFRNIIQQTLDRLPPEAWPAWVLSNHDVVRAVSRYHLTPAMTRSMLGLLMTIKGTPFLYNGEELGLGNARIPRAWVQDPVGKRYWPLPVGRDGERAPIPWDSSPGGGFTLGTPWLPLNTSAAPCAAQSADPSSVLNFTRRLVWCRSHHTALNSGDMTLLEGSSPDCLCFTRDAPAEHLMVMINLSSRSVPLESARLRISSQILFSSESRPVSHGLAPWEVRITSNRAAEPPG